MEGKGGVRPTNRKKIFAGFVLAAIFLFGLLSIPAPDPPVAEGVVGKTFTWKQDTTWKALEASFREARNIGGNGFKGYGFSLPAYWH